LHVLVRLPAHCVVVGYLKKYSRVPSDVYDWQLCAPVGALP
jgi:hypothetical protein